MKNRYDYDKKILKGLGYTDFLKAVSNRTKHIEAQPEEDITSKYNVNLLAERLHPSVQHALVSAVKDFGGAKLFTLVPDPARGTERLAFFRAGQYVSVHLKIGETVTTRPYTICSGPAEALGEDSRYGILVKDVPDGFAAPWILENWRVGTEIELSGPMGEFYHQELRDKDLVIAAAGGSGITPFYSMARAIADGTEHFSLTILYGNKRERDILLRDELRETEEKSGGRVRVIHVLSDEKREGFSHGFIGADLIRTAAAGNEHSLFVCGPEAMYRHIRKEAEVLGLPRRSLRFEAASRRGPSWDPKWPAELAGKTFRLSVTVRGEIVTGTCLAEESLLSAVERMGIAAPSACRSGECGWCHSRLISGEVFIPEENDGRRMADRTYGWIHPCSAYPLGDVAIEVFPA